MCCQAKCGAAAPQPSSVYAREAHQLVCSLSEPMGRAQFCPQVSPSGKLGDFGFSDSLLLQLCPPHILWTRKVGFTPFFVAEASLTSYLSSMVYSKLHGLGSPLIGEQETLELRYFFLPGFI